MFVGCPTCLFSHQRFDNALECAQKAGVAGQRDRNPPPAVGVQTPLGPPELTPRIGEIRKGGFISRGGRPKKHATDRAAKAAASRAYRDRKKQEQQAANDALLASL